MPDTIFSPTTPERVYRKHARRKVGDEPRSRRLDSMTVYLGAGEVDRVVEAAKASEKKISHYVADAVASGAGSIPRHELDAFARLAKRKRTTAGALIRKLMSAAVLEG